MQFCSRNWRAPRRSAWAVASAASAHFLSQTDQYHLPRDRFIQQAWTSDREGERIFHDGPEYLKKWHRWRRRRYYCLQDRELQWVLWERRGRGAFRIRRRCELSLKSSISRIRSNKNLSIYISGSEAPTSRRYLLTRAHFWKPSTSTTHECKSYYNRMKMDDAWDHILH